MFQPLFFVDEESFAKLAFDSFRQMVDISHLLNVMLFQPYTTTSMQFCSKRGKSSLQPP